MLTLIAGIHKSKTEAGVFFMHGHLSSWLGVVFQAD